MSDAHKSTKFNISYEQEMLSLLDGLSTTPVDQESFEIDPLFMNKHPYYMNNDSQQSNLLLNRMILKKKKLSMS